MQININPASAAAATAISVIDEYFQELHRIERIPHSASIDSGVYRLTFDLDAPKFEMVNPVNGNPYTRLLLTGTLQRRFGTAAPEVFPLDVKALVSLVDSPGPVVGLRFDGLDEPASTPLTEADVGALLAGPMGPVIAGFNYPSGRALIDGFKRFEEIAPNAPISAVDWKTAVTLMPGNGDTVDSFVASIATIDAHPTLTDSFIPVGQEFAVAFSNSFLDLIFGFGAKEYEGKTIGEAKILRLKLSMNPDSVQVDGKAVTEITALPDVNVTFVGPMHPFLVRGTTILGFDMEDVDVDVGDFEEVFYEVMKWFAVVFAAAALFSGIWWVVLIGIVTWATAVQFFWNADVAIDDAPNVTRESVADALGAGLRALSESLDDETPVGQAVIQSTPDSVEVIDGHMIFFAQVLVKPISMKLATGEYSKALRRFVIFELEGGRRFRAQELARLMAEGKIVVPGFHQVGRKYIRANPDNIVGNNLLRTFKANATTEVVLPNA